MLNHDNISLLLKLIKTVAKVERGGRDQSEDVFADPVPHRPMTMLYIVTRQAHWVPITRPRCGGIFYSVFSSISIDGRGYVRYVSAIANKNRDRSEPPGWSLA